MRRGRRGQWDVRRLGDLVAAKAEGSTVVEELEAAASERCSTAA